MTNEPKRLYQDGRGPCCGRIGQVNAKEWETWQWTTDLHGEKGFRIRIERRGDSFGAARGSEEENSVGLWLDGWVEGWVHGVLASLSRNSREHGPLYWYWGKYNRALLFLEWWPVIW